VRIRVEPERSGPFALRLAANSKVSAFDSDAGAIAALQKAAASTSGLKPVKAAERDLFRRPLMPQELRDFDGVTYVMERGLVADVAIVHAYKGDTEGNLVYRKTARNFNPMMAAAGKVTVAEVEHLVAAGEIDPDAVHTPGIFVQRIVHAPNAAKPIEKRTTRPRVAA